MAEMKPNVAYQWKDDEKFELSGKEFELLINGTRAILNSPEAQKVLVLASFNEVLEKSLKKAFDEGKVFEAPKEDEAQVVE